jgi:hypothetical protein
MEGYGVNRHNSGYDLRQNPHQVFDFKTNFKKSIAQLQNQLSKRHPIIAPRQRRPQ